MLNNYEDELDELKTNPARGTNKIAAGGGVG